MKKTLSSIACLFAIVSFAATPVAAVDYFWDGSTGNWQDASSWGGTVPGFSENANITIGSGNVVYNTAPDFYFNGTITIGADASWTQADILNWISIGALGGVGVLNINGGTFDVGSSTAFRSGFDTGETGSGTVNLNSGSFLYESGEIRVGGNSEFNVFGGNVVAQLISFDGGNNAAFNISGGTVTLTGDFQAGIFSTGEERYVNMTGGSLVLENVATFELGDLLTSGRLRANGLIDSDLFVIESFGDGGTLITVIPEPSTYALGFGLIALLLVYRRRLRK